MPAVPKELEQLLYTVPQVAKVIGVSDKTVTLLIRRGDLPSLRIGRRVLVSKAALTEWADVNRDTHFDGYPGQAS